MFHRPGLPLDLPQPDDLWTRLATCAVVCSGLGRNQCALVDGALTVDHGSGYGRLVLAPVAGGRFLLLGDAHGSTLETGRRRPTDPFEDAPTWLPWEWLDRTGNTAPHLAYWWDGAWARATLPDDWDDDGLGSLVGWYATDTDTVTRVAALIRDGADASAVQQAVRVLVDRAASRTVDTGSVTDALAPVAGADPVRALETARLLGLTEGSDDPGLPAGSGGPAPVDFPLIGLDEWGLLVGDAVRRADDHWLEWADQDPSGRVTDLAGLRDEVEARPPGQRPAWADLLDPGVPYAPPWPGPPTTPSVTPARLDADGRSALLDRIRAILTGAAEGYDWTQLRLSYRSLVGYAGGELTALLPDGEHQLSLPPSLRTRMAALRSATYAWPLGAWFSVDLVLERSAGWRITYDREGEPAFCLAPTAFSYALDARYFPRDPAHTPLWLAERLRAARG